MTSVEPGLKYAVMSSSDEVGQSRLLPKAELSVPMKALTATPADLYAVAMALLPSNPASSPEYLKKRETESDYRR